MKTIDCRDMACPLPVVTVKRALEEPGTGALNVLLDDGPPRENVVRFARNRGFEVTEVVTESGVMLEIRGAVAVAVVGKQASPVASGKKVILVSSDRLGDGPEELGCLLMRNFITTLLESAELPDRIFLVNRGVLLATEGSELLEVLEKLGNRGVEVQSCGVCLDFFGKRDAVQAGGITTMFAIVEALMAGGGAVRL